MSINFEHFYLHLHNGNISCVLTRKLLTFIDWVLIFFVLDSYKKLIFFLSLMNILPPNDFLLHWARSSIFFYIRIFLLPSLPFNVEEFISINSSGRSFVVSIYPTCFHYILWVFNSLSPPFIWCNSEYSVPYSFPFLLNFPVCSHVLSMGFEPLPVAAHYIFICEKISQHSFPCWKINMS